MSAIDRSSLENRYEAALAIYFNREEEKGLFEISQVSKELVSAELGPDILIDIHSTCLQRLLAGRDPVTVARMANQANEPLLSGIMAYAMNYYSFMDLLRRVQGELREKARKLEEANDRLRELDRLKTMFIATMNHELRTPLNTIIGYTRDLLDEWVGPLNESQKENLATVLTSGRHLMALINDLIDVSRLEAGTMGACVESFEIRDLLREGMEVLSREAADKGLAIGLDASPMTIRTDRRRLLQALLNLLSNAVKYTEAGEVRVAARSEGDEVVIEVADTGIGIPEADRPRLFTPFTRLEGGQQAPGTGLGLYFTRKLATEILRGELTYGAGEGGRGSVFSLRIPAVLTAGDRPPGVLPRPVTDRREAGDP